MPEMQLHVIARQMFERHGSAAIAQASWDQSYAPANWDIRAQQDAWHVPSDKKILGGTEFFTSGDTNPNGPEIVLNGSLWISYSFQH